MKIHLSSEECEILDETESSAILPVRIITSNSSKLISDKGKVKEEDIESFRIKPQTKDYKSLQIERNGDLLVISVFDKEINEKPCTIKCNYCLKQSNDSESLLNVRKLIGKDLSKRSSDSILKIINI